MDRKTSEDTRLLFCTTGVLKEKLINKKNMHEFTHVILDEVRYYFFYLSLDFWRECCLKFLKKCLFF